MKRELDKPVVVPEMLIAAGEIQSLATVDCQGAALESKDMDILRRT